MKTSSTLCEDAFLHMWPTSSRKSVELKVRFAATSLRLSFWVELVHLLDKLGIAALPNCQQMACKKGAELSS